MLQSVATLVSVFIAVGMIAVIAAILADDWVAVVRAFGLRTQLRAAVVQSRARVEGRATVRVVRVSSQSVPMRAAA